MKPDPHQVLLFHNLRRVFEAAAEQGIDAAPLKGAHLVTSVYPDDEDRGPLADVDFLVRERDWDRVCELMGELGFARRLNPKRATTIERFHEAGFYLEVGADQPLLFEPHRQLVQPARHPIDHDAIWQRSEEGTFEGAPCRRLSADDHVLHAVVHLMSHRFRDPRRQLRDIELLVRRGGASLDEVVDRAREWECANAAWLALELLHETAPDLGADRYAARLAPPLPVRRALRLLVPDASGFRLPEIDLRLDQAVLWPWLIDGPRQGLGFAAAFVELRVRDLFS
jgi:hypothetical protein